MKLTREFCLKGERNDLLIAVSALCVIGAALIALAPTNHAMEPSRQIA